MVSGTVIRGEGRGRRLGIPTANVEVPEDKLVPAGGVYAAYATVEATTHQAAVNIGVRPTFGGTELAVEAHLLDFAGDLYGRRIKLQFLRRLRDERKFPDVEALRAQIAQDVAAARRDP